MDPFDALDSSLASARRMLIRERARDLGAVGAVACTAALAAAVGLAAVTPDAIPVRLTLLLALLVGGGGVSMHLLVDLPHRLARPEELGRVLRRRLPAVGFGVEAVAGLRPRMDDGTSFSPALLAAEARRLTGLLAAASPAVLCPPGRARRRMRWALVVAVLALLGMAAVPWFTARGVRNLLGLSGRFPVSWLVGPPTSVGVLAYDLRTTVLLPSPSGEPERIPGDESGDITAPVGVSVEVAGRLFRPATTGHLVLRSLERPESASAPARVSSGNPSPAPSRSGGTEERETRVPLELAPDGAFKATFPVRASGQWHLSVVVPPGLVLDEEARRRLAVADLEPPVVTVVAPARLGVEPGESALLRWLVDSPTGIAGVDAVYTFPLEPDRPPLRVHLRDVAAGLRQASGELVFLMPSDALDLGGRVDVVIEGFGRLSQRADGTGRSEPVRFFVDVPSVRRLALVEGWERLNAAAIALLGDLLALPGPGNPGLPPVSLRALRDLADRVRKAATAAAGESDAAAMRPLLEQAAGALEEAGQGVSTLRDLALRQVEQAVLVLDDGVARERRALLSGWLTDIERWSVRLREISSGAGTAGAAEEAARLLVRARRALRLVDGAWRRMEGDATLEGGPARLAPRRLGETAILARDAVLTAESSRVSGWAPPAALRSAAAALAAVVASWRSAMDRQSLAGGREGVLPAEVGANLRLAGRLQREVMDRTAQSAFVLKRRADAMAQLRAPDVRAMEGRIEEAREILGRPEVGRLDRYDAEDVVRLMADVANLADLVAGRDLETAARVAEDAAAGAARLAGDLREEASFREDAPGDPGALRAVSSRMAKAAPALAEVAHTLSAWRRDRTALVDSADRSDLLDQKKVQERALAAAKSVAEAMRRAAGGEAGEAAGVAVSARRNMEEASRRLAEWNPGAAEAHQRQAIQDLNRLRHLLERGSMELARRLTDRDDPEELTLPPAASRRASDDLERAVREHLAEPVPEAFADLVRQYYEAILKP
jgi:hypothetical protein